MPLMRIRLELARISAFPSGSSRHGYEFIAPVTPSGQIDSARWHGLRDRCTVRRFWGEEAEERGFLRHAEGGWSFDYGCAGRADDEPFFKLDQQMIFPGAYVTVRDHDGVQRPFKIVEVCSAMADSAA